jgi:hypothetical protein
MMVSMQYSPVNPVVHNEFPQMHSWSDEFLFEHNFATAQRHEMVSVFSQGTAEFSFASESAKDLFTLAPSKWHPSDWKYEF